MSNLLMKVDRESEEDAKEPLIAAALEACDALLANLSSPDVIAFDWKEGPKFSGDIDESRADRSVWKEATITKPNAVIHCRQGDTDDGSRCTSAVTSWKAFSTHIKAKHPDNPPHPWTKKYSRPEDDLYGDCVGISEPRVLCEYCGLTVNSRAFNVRLSPLNFVCCM